MVVLVGGLYLEEHVFQSTAAFRSCLDKMTTPVGSPVDRAKMLIGCNGTVIPIDYPEYTWSHYVGPWHGLGGTLSSH